MEIKNNKLFLGGVSAEELAEEYDTPLYVYEEDKIREQYHRLYDSITWPKKKVLFACKANSNLAILKVLKEEGCGIDAVSPGEVYTALKVGFKKEDIMFTGNNVRDDEMKYVHEQGVLINVESLDQLERFGKMFPGSEVAIRINPDVGAGFNSHVITGGPDSKFGVYYDRMGDAKEIAEKYDLKIVGIHSNIGSGILNPEDYKNAMEMVMKTAKNIDGLQFIDFGGGIGVPYKPTDKEIDIEKFGEETSKLFSDFCEGYGKELTIMFEPGKYLMTSPGFLLTRVNTLKRNPKHQFVGTDTGFNHLIRPILYGAYHGIINASNVEDEKEKVLVVGNICESGDIFTQDGEGPVDREISRVRRGDILAITSAGAYGMAQACPYNSRPLPAEVMVKDGKARLIRERGEFDDLFYKQKY
jgi:diaminopimelate decarboxylase